MSRLLRTAPSPVNVRHDGSVRRGGGDVVEGAIFAARRPCCTPAYASRFRHAESGRFAPSAELPGPDRSKSVSKSRGDPQANSIARSRRRQVRAPSSFPIAMQRGKPTSYANAEREPGAMTPGRCLVDARGCREIESREPTRVVRGEGDADNVQPAMSIKSDADSRPRPRKPATDDERDRSANDAARSACRSGRRDASHVAVTAAIARSRRRSCRFAHAATSYQAGVGQTRVVTMDIPNSESPTSPAVELGREHWLPTLRSGPTARIRACARRAGPQLPVAECRDCEQHRPIWPKPATPNPSAALGRG